MKALFVLCLSVLNVVARGFMIKTLWAWFVLPVFTTMPQLTTLSAYGLSMVVQAFCSWKWTSAAEREDAKNSDLGETMLHNQIVFLITSGIFLLSGWIIHSLM